MVQKKSSEYSENDVRVAQGSSFRPHVALSIINGCQPSRVRPIYSLPDVGFHTRGRIDRCGSRVADQPYHLDSVLHPSYPTMKLPTALHLAPLPALATSVATYCEANQRLFKYDSYFGKLVDWEMTMQLSTRSTPRFIDQSATKSRIDN